MKLFKRLSALTLALALILGLGACSQKAEDTATANDTANTESTQEASDPVDSQENTEDKELEEITFVLDWTPNTNHTGIYVAQKLGYFEEAGLTVNVVQPPDGGAEMLVGSGGAQFGVSFQDYIAPALIGDDQLPITAVAAMIQHNTSGIISRKGEGMDTPKGLEGHKYATWDLPVEKATIQQVMEADGGDFSKVEMIPSTVTDEVTALETKSVDAIWVYEGWAGVACQVAGLETDYFAFADIDPVFDFYTPVIIANNDYLTENPDQAKAFLEAATRGYEYCIENPKEAADILMEAVPELAGNADLIYASQEFLAAEYQADAARWGEFDAARWSGFFQWLNDNQLLDGEVDVNAGFTNDYLPVV